MRRPDKSEPPAEGLRDDQLTEVIRQIRQLQARVPMVGGGPQQAYRIDGPLDFVFDDKKPMHQVLRVRRTISPPRPSVNFAQNLPSAVDQEHARAPGRFTVHGLAAMSYGLAGTRIFEKPITIALEPHHPLLTHFSTPPLALYLPHILLRSTRTYDVQHGGPGLTFVVCLMR
ncbi:hypothetical protein CMQ_6246 [Grosmannia clavigera kw1407]|uniref:Uncharacterized protein n=1 Tax=Grosmannia clavigera (strain kw1407 / UAMH 11150) TaxID=655863 RepID=F0XMN5_GROCL|nr:uncharacterized protein CMQ_6246 [Grosmannia clavigera kw1407]EFX01304.1 hypothetical protein CMQ_6246 [Grosmannia clavigera kw1407]